MSIRNNPILGQLLRLLYPPHCVLCGESTHELDQILCPRCQLELPFTYDWLYLDNELSQRVWHFEPRIISATALLRYSKGVEWRRLVMDLKYNRYPRYGELLGSLLGGYLAQSGHFEEVDLIIPVPLHPMRRLARGYNQAEYIARGVANSLGAEVAAGAVKRHRNNRSQSSSPRINRWSNAENLFTVIDTERLAGRHLLLVDDIFTTGSTILSLASELLERVEGVSISIATLGVVGHHGGDQTYKEF